MPKIKQRPSTTSVYAVGGPNRWYDGWTIHKPWCTVQGYRHEWPLVRIAGLQLAEVSWRSCGQCGGLGPDDQPMIDAMIAAAKEVKHVDDPDGDDARGSDREGSRD